VRPLDALLLGDLLHRDVQARARARRAVIDLAGIGPGVVDEFAKRLPRRVGLHHDPEGVAGDVDDVGKILGRIE
jgi:hypothetical protein